jgi:hypothetical protein
MKVRIVRGHSFAGGLGFLGVKSQKKRMMPIIVKGPVTAMMKVSVFIVYSLFC